MTIQSSKTPSQKFITDQSPNNLSKLMLDLVELFRVRKIAVPWTIANYTKDVNASPESSKFINVYKIDDLKTAYPYATTEEKQNIQAADYVKFQTLEHKDIFLHNPYYFRIGIAIQTRELYQIFTKINTQYGTQPGFSGIGLPTVPDYPNFTNVNQFVINYLEIFPLGKSWEATITRGTISPARYNQQGQETNTDTPRYNELAQEIIVEYFMTPGHKYVPKPYY